MSSGSQQMVSSIVLLPLLLVSVFAAKNPCQQEHDKNLEIIEKHPEVVGITLPNCEEDGTYAPLQCRESVCYCAHKFGFQLKGYRFSVKRANEAACECAREQFYLQNILVGKRVNCDEIGNYENVQCLGSKCYCVNKKYGTQVGQAVHVDEVENLLTC